MKNTNYHRQQGVVLLIALIVLVAMTMAGIAMVRSVSIGNQVAGNLAFQQANLTETDAGIEAALGLIAANAIPDYEADYSNYYFATRQKQAANSSDCSTATTHDFGNGIPKALYCATSPYKATVQGTPINSTTIIYNKSTGTYSTPGSTVVPSTGLTGIYLTYIIERLCTTAGKVDESTCATFTPLSPAAQTVDIFDNLTAEPKAYYRVTIRADGPNNSLSFVQTMLGA